MATLDLSRLKPLSVAPPDAAAQGAPAPSLDTSSLRAYGSEAPATDAGSSQPEAAPTWQDTAKQFGYGIVSGIPHAIEGVSNAVESGVRENPASIVNVPVAMGTGIAHEIIDPLMGRKPVQPVSGETIGKGLSTVGLNPDDYLPAPQNAPERVARMVGEGAVTAAIPGLGEESLAAKILSTGRNALTGAASGLVGQGAAEVAPEPLKPAAGLIGGVVGGALPEAGMATLSEAGKGVGHYTEPFTKGGQERAVGRQLNEAATDPQAAQEALAAPAEIVAGSRPTTFQQSGDMGLGGLERAVAAQNSEVFNAVRADQNAARLDALTNIQSEGHPEAVSNMVRNEMSAIDDQTQNALDLAQQNAREHLAAVGAPQSAEETGSAIQNAIQPGSEAATNAAQGALDTVSPVQSAEAIGNQARQAMQAQLDAAKAHESQLWNAVDPNGTLQVTTSPIRSAVADIYGNISPERAATLMPSENALAQVVGDYGPTLPFARLTELRSLVSQAMRNAKSPLSPNDLAYGRLSQLRSAIENAISDTVAGKAAEEQQAVAAGALAPEDTMAANMQRQVQGWYAGRNAQVGTNSPESVGTVSARGLAGSVGASGAERQGSIGSDATSSGPGIPENAGSGPFVDQQAADRLATASGATKERKQTFGQAPVNRILQRPGNTLDYTMAPADVAGQLWQPGTKGASTVNSILKASNNSPDAIDAIRNAAGMSLRAKASDGILTPQQFSQWRASHGPALNALEQAAPGTTARFENAAQASSALNRYRGLDIAPSALPGKFFATGDKGFETVNDLRNLVGKEKADQLLSGYAADSLHKIAVTPEGTLDPKKFDTWRKQHSGALRAMPELSAKMDNAANASEYMNTIARVRKEDMDALQRSTLGKLMGLEDPADVTREIGSIFGKRDAVRQMRALADQARRDPEALQGLRKAVIDHMMGKLVSNTEAATSGRNLLKSDQFQTFLGKNEPALAELFTPDEIGSMRAIAQDLKRANRSISAVKLPGGSNTAQDTAAIMKHGGNSFLHQMIHGMVRRGLELGASGVGFTFGGLPGLALGAGASVAANALRDAGINNMRQLLVQAMLNPDLARALMAKAPMKPHVPAMTRFTKALGRASMFAPMVAQRNATGFARGGSVKGYALGGTPDGISFSRVISSSPGHLLVEGSDGNVYSVGGDRNLRNNNPGNIEYGSYAKSLGAIGSDGRFAVFPDYSTGRSAQEDLQFNSPSYAGMTIQQAINKYAPPSENNSAGYASGVASAVGVPVSTKLSALSPEQRIAYLRAQQNIEGSKPQVMTDAFGNTVRIPPANVPIVSAPSMVDRYGLSEPVDPSLLGYADTSGPGVVGAVNDLGAPTATLNLANAPVQKAPQQKGLFDGLGGLISGGIAMAGNAANAVGSGVNAVKAAAPQVAQSVVNNTLDNMSPIQKAGLYLAATAKPWPEQYEALTGTQYAHPKTAAIGKQLLAQQGPRSFSSPYSSGGGGEWSGFGGGNQSAIDAVMNS